MNRIIKFTTSQSIKIIFIYCLLLSAAFLLLCTKSSPLYPLNDWVDANAFFTMGKGMMNGKVLYRDLFEQKGPLLYFLHGLAYLISNRTFLGVYLIELISFSFFLLFCYKIISLFSDFRYSVVSLALLTAAILNMRAFVYGDSAEEFCLPLIGYSLYCLIHYYKNVYPANVKKSMVLLNGIAAGLVLWIKFSLLGFWIGWMLSLTAFMLANQNYRQAVKSCFIFVAGILLSTLPWIVYFGLNHSIKQWLDTYLLVNAFCYPISLSLIGRIAFIVQELGSNMVKNPIPGILMCIGIPFFIFTKRFLKSRSGRLALFLCFLFLALGVYGGGRSYKYYFLIFAPFSVFGLIGLFDFAGRYFRIKMSQRQMAFALLASLIMTFPATLLYNHNAPLSSLKKNNMFQYQFASIIDRTKHPTLLNYGYLDMGLYTVAGVTPNVKFFQKLNIPYSKFPLNLNAQRRYIKEGKVDFVLIREKNSQSPQIPGLYNKYKLIKEAAQTYKGVQYNYLLFQKVG